MIKTGKIERKTALILVGLGAFLIPFMGSSLSIALPLIGDDLTGNIILLGWLPTVFTLANAAFLLPFGKLADIHGRKKIFAYGVVIYTVASLLAALSPSVTFLIFGSFLQGLGCALIFATGVALLSSVYPPEHRGEALGFFVTAVFVGLFLGPLLGGFLAQSLGWRSIFLFNVPLGLFLLSLIFWKLKGEWYGSKDVKFDYLSSAIYIPSLVALFYGFTALGDTMGRAIFTAGILGFILFIYMETRTKHPILNLKLLGRRVSALPAVSQLFINVSTTALWTLLSLYLQDLLHFGPLWAALILSVQPLMVALLSPATGRLSDRMDGRIFMISGSAAITMGLLVLSTLGLETALWWVIMGLVLVGVGTAFFAPVTSNLFVGSMSQENYGMASATQSTMIYAGQTFSLGILLLIFTGFLGATQITSANFDVFLMSLKTAFTIFAVFSGVGLVLSFFMRKPWG
jgi:MFS family permease